MRPIFLLSVLGIFCLLPTHLQGQSVTIEPDKDNTLYEDVAGSLSNGAGPVLFAGTTNAGDLRRGLLHFDVQGNLPAGATITGATLTLTMNRTISGAQDVSLHTVSADWGEGTSVAGGQGGGGASSTTNDATWIHTFFSSSNWATAGGEFNATASATTSVAGNGTYTWTSAQLLADVQGWASAPATNFGWLLMGDESATGSAKRFATREASANTRPKLTITYTLPCQDPDVPTLTTSANPVCPGTAVSFTVNGNLNDATAWYLYTGSCGGTLLDSSAAGIFTVNPTATTTYFVRGEGGCVTPGTCATITITILPQDDASFSYPDGGEYCEGSGIVSPTITGTTGGTFSVTPAGLTINSGTGDIDPTTSTAGTYSVQYLTPGGASCADSSTLSVIIHPVYDVADTLQICTGDSVLFDGQFIKDAGDYNATFSSAQGCDSMVTLTLELITSFNIDEDVTLCEGETVMLGTQVISTPGTFTETFTTNGGCDSTVNLTVTVVVVDTAVTRDASTLTASADGASFQWINCADNQPIDGETNASFTPDVSGEYAVVVEQLGCTDTSACFQVEVTDAIGDPLSIHMTAYPNPTPGQVSIDLGTMYREVSVRVMTVHGQVVQQKEVELTNRMTLDLSDLPTGLYVIEAEAEGQRGMIRIVRE